jgi:hypothetical protein
MRKAASRPRPSGYTEKHHVFPVSIYGKNQRIVLLTAREHYIAHALLEKVCIKRYGLKHYKTIKMTFAHCAMKSNGKYCNSALYEYAKKRRSDNMKGRPSGAIFSAKTRELMRQRRLGSTASTETRRKMSESHKGKKMPPKSAETIQRMSEAQKGKPSPMQGKKHSEESKEKMRQGIKSNPPSFDDERRNRISLRIQETWKHGIFATSEYREKLSQSLCKKMYELFSPSGEKFETNNIAQFAKEHNLDYSALYKVVKGTAKSHKGWTGRILK